MSGKSGMETARELLQSEMQLSVIQMERWTAEVRGLEQRLSELQTTRERCRERLTRLSEVLRLLEGQAKPATE